MRIILNWFGTAIVSRTGARVNPEEERGIPAVGAAAPGPRGSGPDHPRRPDVPSAREWMRMPPGVLPSPSRRPSGGEGGVPPGGGILPDPDGRIGTSFYGGGPGRGNR